MRLTHRGSRARLLLAVAAVIVVASAAGSSRAANALAPTARSAEAATCTAGEKQRRQRALASYRRRIAKERAAYFRKHASAKARTVFVKRQNAKLKALQRAAGCRVRPPVPGRTPPAPAPTPPLPPPLQPAPPTPPPPPPALSGPGAPATYVFGPEVTAIQQMALRDALDLGARYYRTALRREVPRFDLWAHNDSEAIARVFLEKSGEVTTLEEARALWGNLVAHAGTHGLWVGPLWFSSSGANATKILAKEEFILLLYSIAGANSLNSDQDTIPRAGPRWLSEGTSELTAYLAIAYVGLADMSAVRADWAERAKSSPVTLQRLAVRRGQLEAGANAWGIMPLAVERLVEAGGTAKLLSYFEAIGRGEPWQAAFAATFGKSIDSFYAEFEAYRSGL